MEIEISDTEGLHDYIDRLTRESSRILDEHEAKQHPSLLEILKSDNVDKGLLFHLEVIRIAKERLAKEGNGMVHIQSVPSEPK